MLTSTVIRGSSVYTPAELFAVYRRHLGQPIDRELAQAVSAALAELYVRDGYARPQIAVDGKLAGAGVLRIDITETRITEIALTGDPGPYRERLETLTSAVTDGALFRQHELRAVLRRMRELPGLSLSASTARDASTPNAYRLDVQTEFDRITGSLRMTNRGTEEVGPNFLLGQILAHGVAGRRTHAGLLFGATTDHDEYRGLGVTSTTDLGNDGMALSVLAFRSRSWPDEAPVDRDILYLRDRISVGLVKPLLDRVTWTAGIAASLEWDDLQIERDGSMIRDERLRMLELALNVRQGIGEPVQYAHSVELVKGLGGLGSGLTALDLAEDPRRADFWIARARFVRLAQLNERWSWRIDAFAQHSPYVLPYGQRFKIGGDRLGRGFEVAEIAGDRGMGAKAELQRRVHMVDQPAIHTAVYGFYDLGAAWKENVSGRESAATTGVGLSARSRRLRGSIELAMPLTHADVEGKKEPSLFVEFTWQL